MKRRQLAGIAMMLAGAGLGCRQNDDSTASGGGVAPSRQPVVYALSATRSGDGQGRVASAPAGIDCGDDCTEAFVAGSTITLTATPADVFFRFAGWNGACSGTADCVVVVDSKKSVSASFEAVSIDGSWSGTTGQGRSLVFQTANNSVTSLTLVLTTDCGEEVLSYSSFPPNSFSNHAVTLQRGGFEATVMLSSPTRAQGQVEYFSSACGTPVAFGFEANRT